MEQSKQSDTVALATAIGDAIRSTQPKRKITFGEFQSRKPKRELPAKLFQNGFEITARDLTDEQFDLALKLKAGKFLDDYVKVESVNKGGAKKISISYPCDTVDKRIANAARFSDFTDLLRKLTAPAAAKRN